MDAGSITDWSHATFNLGWRVSVNGVFLAVFLVLFLAVNGSQMHYLAVSVWLLNSLILLGIYPVSAYLKTN